MKKIFIFIGVVIFFTACDPSYFIMKTIINNSDKMLFFIHSYPVNQQWYNDTIKIQEHSEKRVFEEDGMGGIGDEYPCQYLSIDSVRVISSASLLPVQKDIKDSQNWNRIIKRGNGSASATCTFEIFQSDLR